MFRLVAVVLTFHAGTVPAQNIPQHLWLPDACDAYAKALVEALTAAGETSVAVGRVATEERFGLATGRGVELELTAALEKARPGIVDPKAKYAVRGEVTYRSTDDPTQKFAVIKFHAATAPAGRELAGAEQTLAVTHTTEVGRLIGATVHLTPAESLADYNRQFAKAMDAPSAFIEQAMARTVADSPFTFEVMPRKGAAHEAVPVSLANGQPVAKIGKGDGFVVKISNRSPGDIGVRLFFDSMDSYHFAQKRPDGKPFATIYHVAAMRGLRMMGWVFAPVEWEEFQMGKPLSVELPPSRASKWGSLTVVVHPMRPNPDIPGRLLTHHPVDFITIRLLRE